MRAAWYERNGAAAEVLEVGEMPTPEPGPGEVLVRLEASGVNPSDVKSRRGSRPMSAPRVIPHSDGAGVIESVGEGVSDSRVGERVWIWNGQWGRPLGTAATHIALPEEQAAFLPEPASFEAGACLGIPALTAYQAVTTDRPCRGESLLVAGGAGAVGHYAIQMAKLLGAKQVLATVSSPEKGAEAVAAGADAAIDYKREDVAERVRSLTGGRGVDRVVEVDMAANAKLLPQVIAPGGLCAAYGSGAPEITFTFWPMVLSGAAVRFFIVYEMPLPWRREAIAAINGWLQQDALKHRIAGAYPLERIAEAHEAQESGRTVGNIVVLPR